MSFGLVGLILLMFTANPIPAYQQIVQPNLGAMLAVHTIPHLFSLFPLWMVACILLSIDVLARPGGTADANTILARRRSRPWLLGTAGALLAVSLVVAYFAGSIILTQVGQGVTGGASTVAVATVAFYDLALSLLIALALLLLGQAIVSYEIFTGRVLPRRSFIRHWRNVIILAAGYALIVSWSITAHLRPIYGLLLAALLLAAFYALYSWRSFWERDQYLARLRPFVQERSVQRQNSPDSLQTSSPAGPLLAALSHDILGTSCAQLVAMGSVAPLISAPLTYPAGVSRQPSPSLPRDLNAGMTALDAAAFAPYRWAISLWDERGRIGALLIGEKEDGGLYSQEEMETAQAAGERIVHLLAGEEMVRRLMELQRKRTVEQRVMDLRTRRALHDEVLPALHLAVLQLSGADHQQATVQEAVHTLAEAHQQIAALLTAAQPAPSRGPDPCELVGGLHALVENDFAHTFEEITWRGMLSSECKEAEKSRCSIYVDPVVGEVVLGAAREVIRNAASHGSGTVERMVRIYIGLCREKEEAQGDGALILTIEDNGIGVDASRAMRQAEANGSGSGLALHSTLLAVVGGYLTVESPPQGGTLVRVTVVGQG